MFLANFETLEINNQKYTFRYNTEYKTSENANDTIGLIVMLNPGSAKPNDKKLSKLKPDFTLRKSIELITLAYAQNEIKTPKEYIIHIENLFNYKEPKSELAKDKAKIIFNELMYRSRELTEDDVKKYNFVIFAWGNIENIQNEKIVNKVNYYRKLFPNAIEINQIIVKNEIMNVNYPVHMRRICIDFNVNKKIFFNAIKGKIKENN